MAYVDIHEKNYYNPKEPINKVLKKKLQPKKPASPSSKPYYGKYVGM